MSGGGLNSCREPTCIGCSRDSRRRKPESVGGMRPMGAFFPNRAISQPGGDPNCCPARRRPHLHQVAQLVDEEKTAAALAMHRRWAAAGEQVADVAVVA